MGSKINSFYSPAKTIESSTPMVVETQESTNHIYSSNQTLPNIAPNAVSPVQSNWYAFDFSNMTQDSYPFSDLDSLLQKQYHRSRPSTASRTNLWRPKKLS